MISRIEIHNFRCFEQTKISGFKQVNLIGGLNNSGKTALLEALYLHNSPRPSTIINLMKFRRENFDFFKLSPENTWNNFFFNHDKEESAEISSNGKTGKLELKCDKSFEPFIEVDTDNSKSDENLERVLSDKEYIKSTLHVNQIRIDEAQNRSLFYIVANYNGISGKQLNQPSDSTKVNFIPTSFILKNHELAKEFDHADFDGKGNYILNAIKLIDPSIKQAKTFGMGENTIYLRREKGNFLPVFMFGEAIGKITNFILKIINNKRSIILIDEIENGIHYTNQSKLWNMFFKLAVEFGDIQIFATTHSIEMLKAFAETGLQEEYRDIAAYVELTRNVRNAQICGICRDPNELDYTMKRGIGVRGE